MEHRPSVIVQWFKDKIEEDVNTVTDLGSKFEAVEYGDVDVVPYTPLLSIDSGDRARENYSTGLNQEITFQLLFTVYHARFGDQNFVQKEADELIETLEKFIHQDTRLDGQIIFGMVTSIEPGFAVREEEVYHAARLTWTGQSRHKLGT